MKHFELNRKWFSVDELRRVGPHANPADLAFVVPGAKVWLRSGSPDYRVISVHAGEASVEWWDGLNVQRSTFRVECLTPEPTPTPPA